MTVDGEPVAIPTTPREFSIDSLPRMVITGGHCLPQLPTGFGIGYTEERTFANLLGRLGEEPTVWAECLFVDPVADIAVLGAPDGQLLDKELDAFEELVENVRPLAVNVASSPAGTRQRGWMLRLDGRWQECTLKHNHGPWFMEDRSGTEGGMSGSPILDDDGRAIGIVATNEMHPRLCWNMPVGLLQQIQVAQELPTS